MNEIDFVLGEFGGEEERFFHLFEDFELSLAFEWSVAFDEFEKKDSHAPYVDFVIVLFTENHLRGHIFDCAAESHPGFDISGESKVTEFDIVVFIEQDIFWLNFWRSTLTSRCMMPRLCMKSRASQTDRKMFLMRFRSFT